MPTATSRVASFSPNRPIPIPATRVKPTNAASPEATKAVRMKSYSSMAVDVVIVAMRVALDVDVAGHDVIAISDAHDLNRRPIEARQDRPSDHLVYRPDHRLASAEIEHAVDHIDQRIELMRAEQNGDLQIATDASGGFDDALLMRGIK